MATAYVGQMAALGTAVCWTVTALAFESAGKKVGSLAVNMIRLAMGAVFLSAFSWVTRGQPLPLDASAHAWIWLSLSGFVGFTLGDMFLFQSFVTVGARISMLIMCAVPPMTALIGWIVMGETLGLNHLIGMGLTICGIGMVIWTGNNANQGIHPKRPFAGVLLAFGGALGQATGLVLSKYGMGDYDAFAATQIRAIAGIIGFIILFFPLRAWQRLGVAFRHRPAMTGITIGAIFGPFLGVSLSLISVKHTATGIASTIMSIVPIMIIPPAILLFKERVTLMEVLGAVVAVVGVAMMFT